MTLNFPQVEENYCEATPNEGGKYDAKKKYDAPDASVSGSTLADYPATSFC